MGTVEIRLLGSPSIQCYGGPLPAFPTRKARDLFFYLVLGRNRIHARDVLVGQFWGDHPEPLARKRFRTTLWRLRSTLATAGLGRILINACQGQVSLRLDDDSWVDTENFQSLVERGCACGIDAGEAIRCLDRAIELYRGDLLEGVYHDWCLSTQHTLKMLFQRGLERRMGHAAASNDWPDAIRFANRLLVHDELREHVHRDLMEFLYRNGDRPKAIQQFRILEALLLREFGVRPMEGTCALFDAICEDRVPKNDWAATVGMGQTPPSERTFAASR